MGFSLPLVMGGVLRGAEQGAGRVLWSGLLDKELLLRNKQTNKQRIAIIRRYVVLAQDCVYSNDNNLEK